MPHQCKITNLRCRHFADEDILHGPGVEAVAPLLPYKDAFPASFERLYGMYYKKTLFAEPVDAKVFGA